MKKLAETLLPEDPTLAQEYQQAVGRLRQENARLAEHRRRLKAEGLKLGELKRALDPFRSFHLQLISHTLRQRRSALALPADPRGSSRRCRVQCGTLEP